MTTLIDAGCRPSACQSTAAFSNALWRSRYGYDGLRVRLRLDEGASSTAINDDPKHSRFY